MAKRLTAQERRQIRQKKTREYWKKRSEVYNKAMLAKGERYVAEDVADQYKKAMGAIEREISLWYQRFGEDNKLTAAQAKVALNAKEMAELRWTVNDYIKHAEENMLTGEWVAQLRNASAKAHISRMDAIMLNIQQQLEVMFGNQLDGMDKTLKDIYNDGFLHTAFEVDKGFGVATSFADINMGKLQQVVNKPWVADGLTFSDRIWRDKATLVDELKTQLAQATIRGDDLPTAVKNISDRMDVSRSNAARLVMTESAYFATKAQQDCFNELGVEKVEFVATLDDRTSPECQGLDGTVMEAKDAKPGTNAPPMHCWCRSCLAPYFGDKEGRSGTRAARDKETGKTVQVPADINYPEWKAAYVDVQGQAEENDLLVGYNGIKNGFSVNYDLVNKKAYHDKYETLASGKAASEGLYKEAIAIFNHRNGTEYEDIAMIDAQTGKLLVKNTTASGDDVRKSGLTMSQANYLYSLGRKYEILHNHPWSTMPSREDIGKLFTRLNAVGSTVVGHNGAIYQMRKLKDCDGIYNIMETVYNNIKRGGQYRTDAQLEYLATKAIIQALERKGYMQYIVR